MIFDLVISALLAIGISSMLACGSGSSNAPPPPPPPSVTDVYAAGFVSNGSNDVATYWKNGTPVTFGPGDLYSIFVSGDDVYVAGDGGSLGSAVYWKNGVPVLLTNGPEAALAWSIFVSGTDVYVAGNETKTVFVPPNTYTDYTVAQYWKNGTPVELTDGTAPATAFAIFVSGADVYVAGDNCHTADLLCNIATYWNNGTPTELSSLTNTLATSIVVSGSDVYVSGRQSNNVAEYWMNNVLTPLTDGTSEATANQIAVSGTNVYVAGADWNARGTFAQYWKNGVPVTLNDGTQEASAFSIAVVAH